MSKLFDKANIAIMSPITKKLDALLNAEGFSLLETQRTKGGNNQAVNSLSYMRKEWERVFIFTHEKTEEKPA